MCSCYELADTAILSLVPSEPCSLEVASVTSNSVTLQWMPPETPNAHTRVGPGPSASLTVKTGKLLILQCNKRLYS